MQKQSSASFFVGGVLLLLILIFIISLSAKAADNDTNTTEGGATIDVTLSDRAWMNAGADETDATVTPVVVTNNLTNYEVVVTGIRAHDRGTYHLENLDADFTAFQADSRRYAMGYGEADLKEGTELEDVIGAAGDKAYEFNGKLSVSTGATTASDEVCPGDLVFTVRLGERAYFRPTPDMLKGTAYAVLTDDGDLIFFRSEETYTAGEGQTVTDIKENVYHGTVYTEIETMNTLHYYVYDGSSPSYDWDVVPWDTASVLQTYVAQGQAIIPVEIYDWFYATNASLIDLSGFYLIHITTIGNITSYAESTVVQFSDKDMPNLADADEQYGGISIQNGTINFNNNTLGQLTDLMGCTLQIKNTGIINVKGVDFSGIRRSTRFFDGDFITVNLENSSFDLYDMNTGDSFIFAHTLTLNANNLNFPSLTNFGVTLYSWITCNADYSDHRSIINLDNITFESVIDPSYMIRSYENVTLNMHNVQFPAAEVFGDLICYGMSGQGYGHIIHMDNVSAPNVRTLNTLIADGGNNVETLENVDFSGVTTVSYEFWNREKNLTLSHVNLCGIQDASEIFSDNRGASLILDNIDFSSVTDASGMFRENPNLTVNNLHFGSLENTSSMFENAQIDFIDPSDWDVSNVTYMYNMFEGCDGLTELDLSGWDTSQVTDMSQMFYGCSNLEHIYVSEGWNTEAVSSSYDMFYDCYNLPHFDSSYTDGEKAHHEYDENKTDGLGYMTYKGELATVTIEDRSSETNTLLGTQAKTMPVGKMLKTGELEPRRYTGTLPNEDVVIYTVTDTSQTIPVTGDMTITRLFAPNADAWYDGAAYTYFDYNENKLTFFRSEETDYNVIYDQGWVKDLNGGVYDTNNGSVEYGLEEEYFYPGWNYNSDYTVEFAPGQKIRPKTISYWFSNCASISGLSQLDTSLCTDMSGAFDSAKIAELDLSGFDTSNVTDMNQMFYYCENLASLNLSGLNTSQVTDMNYMFYGCNALPVIDISDFNTSQVEYMDSMFEPDYYMGENMLEHIYVGSGWSTAALSYGEGNSMFYACTKLPNYDEDCTDALKAYVGEGGYLEYRS